MTPVLSTNTQAILLLTAPLIAVRGTVSHDLLSPGEYKRLARHLRELQKQPADLISRDAAEILRACDRVVPASRLKGLLGRGFQLSQAVERWHARAIWVISRADPTYPRRLKTRLREDAPAVIYGCGDLRILDSGGLAVVGSRRVDDALISYSMEVGRLAARARRTVVSGGAKGVDQAAMRGSLEAGGKVSGVLADDLEKTAMNREHRDLVLTGQLVLISPYDPNAGFNVGHAMKRNKLIYALADASLVVSADLKKGGTWAGAIEQIEKLRLVPVFVRSTGDNSLGLDGLRKCGALPWPNPQDSDSFDDVFKVSVPAPAILPQIGFSLFPNEEGLQTSASKRTAIPRDDGPVSYGIGDRSGDFHKLSDTRLQTTSPKERPGVKEHVRARIAKAGDTPSSESGPADNLFLAVRTVLQKLLDAPMKEVDVAEALAVSRVQAKAWLERLVKRGELEKLKRPVRYVVPPHNH